jgi:hypothetical protein
MDVTNVRIAAASFMDFLAQKDRAESSILVTPKTKARRRN